MEPLSDAARAAWGKTGLASRKKSVPAQAWHPLVSHLIDTGNVAGWLWREFLPQPLKSQLYAVVPGGEAEAERLVCWLAALHDLGKASDFQSKSAWHARVGRRAGLPFSERTRTPHSLVSAYSLRQLLDASGWEEADWAALVLAGHHGVFPGPLWRDVAERALVGEHPGWATIRQELFQAVSAHLDVEPGSWGQVRLPVPLQVGVAGVVILADWLASTESLYSYQAPFSDEYLQVSPATARRTNDVMGLRDVWRPDPSLASAEPPAFFAVRWPAITRPRDVQTKALWQAQRAEGPELMIIEAPMGVGKTEAALAAAEVLAARTGARGIFVGLPTQATSNQMFGRVTKWLEKQEGQTTVVLAHGKAARREEYQQLLLNGIGVDEGDGGLSASQWLSGGKKRLLAPVVVGTVDQLLLAGVAARHVALRMLGLIGKVVIVDEVHAYDAYMSVILRRVLSWLGALQVPVVLLSATLPQRTRRELLAAYSGEAVESAAVMRYPQIISVRRGESQMRVAPARSAGSVPVRLDFLDEPGEAPDAVVNAITELLAEGGSALVIRNTVGRAQRTWQALKNKFGPTAVTLAHSRFTVADRRVRDDCLIAEFGPQRKARLGPRVVVATQVAEQSLDVDFDVGVSDLAPVDLLLQRLGRVHRHHGRERPEPLREPRLLVAGCAHVPDGPPRLPFGSALVYGEHLLWRTAAALRSGGRDRVNLPEDIPGLINEVYGDEPIGPDSWQRDLRRAAEDHQDTLASMELAARQIILPPPDCDALTDIGSIGEARDEDDPEVQATVRLGARTIEVILLREIDSESGAKQQPDHAVPVSAASDPSPIALRRRPAPGEIDTILDQAIRLPQQLTDAALEQTFTPTAWRWTPWLARARVLLLPPDGPLRMADRHVNYSPETGLEVTRA
ncbi:CRISPR-associated helicase/endonuclease Cas3 [Actinomadura chibensis]|uniref:CRISPR-associated helicase/endonuclease Cas3 n=1 Tax=Actinomadura chibensis TaxID=392828 RepID=A0A5D0NHQ1_9ACTN|nr:CRISPR-associated helicase/endonuclease Cas3 [Actinomadura chibensis]TYB43884.1 CRISPR-associated helicase/endonuclease Cas3 [Actinomadura chibensis]